MTITPAPSAPTISVSADEASFLFPPMSWPGGVAEYLGFWLTKPISDEALLNFTANYAVDWEDHAAQLEEEYLEQWAAKQDPEVTAAPNYDEAVAQVLEAARPELRRALAARRPFDISADKARVVARSAQIAAYTSMLASEEDRDAVLSHPVYTSPVNGEDATVQDIAEIYDTDRIIENAFQPPALAQQLQARPYYS